MSAKRWTDTPPEGTEETWVETTKRLVAERDEARDLARRFARIERAEREIRRLDALTPKIVGIEPRVAHRHAIQHAKAALAACRAAVTDAEIAAALGDDAARRERAVGLDRRVDLRKEHGVMITTLNLTRWHGIPVVVARFANSRLSGSRGVRAWDIGPLRLVIVGRIDKPKSEGNAARQEGDA